MGVSQNFEYESDQSGHPDRAEVDITNRKTRGHFGQFLDQKAA